VGKEARVVKAIHRPHKLTLTANSGDDELLCFAIEQFEKLAKDLKQRYYDQTARPGVEMRKQGGLTLASNERKKKPQAREVSHLGEFLLKY
jgi:hypothetical protein